MGSGRGSRADAIGCGTGRVWPPPTPATPPPPPLARVTRIGIGSAGGRRPVGGRGGIRDVFDFEPGLERNAIGLTEVLFQSITHMAPAVATAPLDRARDDPRRRDHAARGGLRPRRLPVHGVLDRASSPGACRRPAACTPTSTRGLGSFVGWLMAWAFPLAEPIVPGSAVRARSASSGRRSSRELTGLLDGLPVAAARGHVRPRRVVPDVPRRSRSRRATGVVLGLIEIGDLPRRLGPARS